MIRVMSLLEVIIMGDDEKTFERHICPMIFNLIFH